jgi:XRE family transcriptional regulator, fatty acid utilization regulator
VTTFIEKDSSSLSKTGLDLVLFGQRLRHIRRSRDLTLSELGQRVGRAPSVLSLLENGRREPKLSLIEALADALGVSASELMRHEAPSRRAQLEISLDEAQHDPIYSRLGLGYLKPGPRVPTEVIEHLLALYDELRKQQVKPTATPEEARLANADLRQMMRNRDNYFVEIEQAAAQALGPVSYSGGALSQGMLLSAVSHHGFSVRYVQDLPRSARSVTDLRNRRIYLRQESLGVHTPRAVLLQTLGHFVLGHSTPTDFADFLRQRVEANYFAAAVLVPEQAAVPFLQQAKDSKNLSVEDLRDVFSVSYEMAAHRLTNLATHHLGLQCHFVTNDAGGTIYKAYENDGVVFPADSPSVPPTGSLRITSTQTRLPVPITAWPRSILAATGHSRSRSACPSTTLAGSVAATLLSGPSRPAQTRPAACVRRPGSRLAGTEWRGLRPARIRIFCPHCRSAASPAWTRPTSTPS